MTNLTLSIPESMRAFLEEQAVKGGYATADAYVQALIREAQQREAKDRLEGLLLEGVDSSESFEVNEDYWERFRTRLRQRHAKDNDQ
jgi:antitoxin ParD1/3/4